MHQTGKKLCAFLLALCMLVSVLPVGVLAAEDNTAAQFVGQQLSLGDDLTMHYYVSVDSEYVASAVMTVAVGGSTVGTYSVAEMTAEENGAYKFSVDLAAAQMADEISLVLTSGEETIAQKTYTVLDYAKVLLEGSYSNETKTLVKEMLNYGAKAQLYFEHNDENLANAGYELEEEASVPSEETEMTIDGSVEGVSFYGASMRFISKLAVRYYFSAPDGLGESIFLVDGMPYTPETKDDLYYIEVPGINPQDMGTAMEVIVSDGETDLTISYSPMCYITRMYNKQSTSESLKNLLQAAYGYYEAAAAYVGLVSYTVSFSDGVAAQIVENGQLATEPSVSKEGYKFLGWYNGDEKFDFSTPITSDISLTAKWEEYSYYMWNDFSDSSSASVWSNGATLTWLDSYEDANGVLKIEKAGGDHYIGGTDGVNWPAAFGAENYAGAVALKFRVKIEGSAFNALTLWGKGGTSYGKIFNDQLATNGWQDFTMNLAVADNYDLLNGMFFTLWTNGVSTIYIDQITAVWNHTVSFSDGVESQTVQTGNLATEPSVSKEGYKFLGWYNGDEKFDFSTPITSDISLTAKWEEIPSYMWNDFTDPSVATVWSNGATLTWLESYDGAKGVLSVAKSGSGSNYVGGTDVVNWPAAFSAEHYAGAVGLKFRMKLEANVFHSITIYGLNGAWGKTVCQDAYGTGEWVEYTVTISADEYFTSMNGMHMVIWTGAAATVYIDEITAVWNHTVSFSDGVESQTVQTGNLATEPAVSKEGYKFLGWYNGDTLFDFSTPIISDVSLTAAWEEIPEYMWNDFSDSSSASVWTNGATLTWLESYEGAEGVLKIEKAAGDHYIGSDNAINWPAVFGAEHYADAIALNFRIKIEGSAFNALTLWGKGGTSYGKIFNDQLATSGWVDFTKTIAVADNYELLNGMFFTLWTNGATTIYIDQITVTFDRSFTVSFSDGVESQTVQSGALATEPAVSKEGYLFLGWYNGDEKFDFSTPITGDISLTAAWEEIPADMWNDFRDSSCASVWTNGATLTWLESYQDAAGVLKIEKSTNGSNYVGATDSANWPAVHAEANYADVIGLTFRVKIEGTALNTVQVWGLNGAWVKTLIQDGAATNSWTEYTIQISAADYFASMNGMHITFWSNGASTLYIDKITVVRETAEEPEETVPANMWYDFEDSASANVWKNSSNLTLTHLESYDGASGVLKFEAAASGETIVGSDNGINWAPMFDEAHYGTITGLTFRVKIEGSAANSLTAWGKGWAWSAKAFDSAYATDGWVEYTIDVSGKAFDTMQGLWLIFWTNGASTMYIDNITVITSTKA